MGANRDGGARQADRQTYRHTYIQTDRQTGLLMTRQCRRRSECWTLSAPPSSSIIRIYLISSSSSSSSFPPHSKSFNSLSLISSPIPSYPLFIPFFFHPLFFFHPFSLSSSSLSLLPFLARPPAVPQGIFWHCDAPLCQLMLGIKSCALPYVHPPIHPSSPTPLLSSSPLLHCPYAPPLLPLAGRSSFPPASQHDPRTPLSRLMGLDAPPAAGVL